MEEPQGQKKSSADLNRLYYDAEVIHKEELLGITFSIREISGEQYTKIVDMCTNIRTSTLDRRKYMEELVKACVLEPAIDVHKMKPGPQTALISRIETVLGITEVVQKNLLK